MIRFSTNRWWKGERVEPSQPAWGTESELEALKECGQAYDDGENIEAVTMENTKQEIVDYLVKEGIDFNEYDTKAELLDLI